MTGSEIGKMKVLLLSYSHIERDSRVLKHVHFFKKSGYDVTVCGYEMPRNKRFNLTEKIKYIYNIFVCPEKSVEILYGNLTPQRAKYHIIICNDWNTLPLGFRIAEKTGAKLVYDSHEMATRQYGIRMPKWYFLIKPLACFIEKKYIRSAGLVSAVSPGIVDALRKKYGLDNVMLLRNIPLPVSEGERPGDQKLSNGDIAIYYHGWVFRHRGIKTLAEAVRRVKHVSLYLRLVGDDQWMRKKYGKDRNIIFLDPLPPKELGRSLPRFDIGTALLPPTSFNHIHALPNKFFEYVLNGLPVLASEENISMAQLIKKYGLGFVIPRFTLKEMVKFLKSLTRERINGQKEKLEGSGYHVSVEEEWMAWIRKIELL